MAFDKSKYDMEYAKEHITRKFLAFNKDDQNDKEILDWLSSVGRGNINGYVKNLIWEDMKKQKNQS